MHELRIAENLIRLRHERKITQEELAVRLGLASSMSAVWRTVSAAAPLIY